MSTESFLAIITDQTNEDNLDPSILEDLTTLSKRLKNVATVDRF